MLRVLVAVLAAAVAAVVVSPAGSVDAAPSCHPVQPPPPPGGNVVVSYSGLAALGDHGIAATISPLREPDVVDGGFVAVWLGVFGTGGWLQVGFVQSRSGDAISSSAYLEYERPDKWVCYVPLTLDPSTPHRLLVLESKQRAHVWRAWIDGVVRPETVRLPPTNSDLVLEATVESKVADRTLTNSYAYSFANVRAAAAPGGRWRAIRNPQRLGPGVALDPSGRDFTASSG